MTQLAFNVLFLCTGNTARSIMAEALLRHLGAGRFNAFSAGSQPKGSVNPFALSTLCANRIPAGELRSKTWDEFAAPNAPRMDAIVTVCDNAAGETCPVWPGHPATAHWGIDDPASVEGSDADQARAFAVAFGHLRDRIARFVELPVATLDPLALKAAMREIGRLQGATDKAKS